MIKTLYIKNFILIDEILLNFKSGFNVLIGETGAGKSIIIKAIDTVLGAKTSKDVLKNPDNHALIEITFEQNNEEIVISREISQTGTKCRLNGALVNLDTIKEQREKLTDIHNQFETYNYMKQSFHIELLDSYISFLIKDYKELLNKQNSEYKKYLEDIKLLEKIKTESKDISDRIEFLKFQIDEIEKADIQENEEEELNAELEVLSNIEELKQTSYGAYWALSGDDGSIIEGLSKIGFELSRIKEYDKSLNELYESFSDANETLKDISYSLRNYSDSKESNPQRLNEISERIELIEKLKRKYGNINETYEKLTLELQEIENKNVSADELTEEIILLQGEMEKNCASISNLREKYALELSDVLTDEIKKLEMNSAEFKIEVKKGDINSKGKDIVEFLITTNNAKELAPLVKAASGGEISRIMLAIKTVFADVDKVQTVIFDEIDTGISGKTSIAVADAIYNLSRNIQVFAITHQPIIASKADCTLLVEKFQTNNDTKISVKELKENEKINALALMSSGVIDNKSVEFAKGLTSR